MYETCRTTPACCNEKQTICSCRITSRTIKRTATKQSLTCKLLVLCDVVFNSVTLWALLLKRDGHPLPPQAFPCPPVCSRGTSGCRSPDVYCKMATAGAPRPARASVTCCPSKRRTGPGCTSSGTALLVAAARKGARCCTEAPPAGGRCKRTSERLCSQEHFFKYEHCIPRNAAPAHQVTIFWNRNKGLLY